jgi:hypothetical protein
MLQRVVQYSILRKHKIGILLGAALHAVTASFFVKGEKFQREKIFKRHRIYLRKPIKILRFTIEKTG